MPPLHNVILDHSDLQKREVTKISPPDDFYVNRIPIRIFNSRRTVAKRRFYIKLSDSVFKRENRSVDATTLEKLKSVGFGVEESLKVALERAARVGNTTPTELARRALTSTVQRQRRPTPVGERVSMPLKLPQEIIDGLDKLVGGSGRKRAEFMHDELKRYVGRLEIMGDDAFRDEPEPGDLTARGTTRVRRKYRRGDPVEGDICASSRQKDITISGTIPASLYEAFAAYARESGMPNRSTAIADALADYLIAHIGHPKL